MLALITVLHRAGRLSLCLCCVGHSVLAEDKLTTPLLELQGKGGSDLNASIKKYRQSIFKLNYKIKKSKTNCKGRQRIAVPQNAAERILANKLRDSEAA